MSFSMSQAAMLESAQVPGAESAPAVPADVNADPSRRVVVDSRQMVWEASPSGSVWRKPLYRRGGEFGPVISLVRYAPGGSFREHAHPEGEEILVLDGVFSDEHGHYPAGTFLMNPHGSRHSPRSVSGCTLFVRLRQYPGDDRPRLVEDTRDPSSWRPGLVEGLRVRPCIPRAASRKMWRWCARSPAPAFSATPTGVARRSSCWRRNSLTCAAAIRKELGFAART
jgi:quercetin dioxygenase-like cupin family protein